MVFLEIFSGCGRLGRSVARDNNWPVLLWDWDLGPQYDLRCKANQWKILGWLRSGFIRGGHLGTPCATFSRARDHPPGPPPLRSDEHVMGLPGLSSANQQKVDEGNLYMRFSVSVLLLALKLLIPFTLENPARSRMWITPSLRWLMRRKLVSLATFEMCMFGTPWRKSTSMLGVHLNMDLLSSYRCLGAKRGLCKRTGQPHLVLCGLDSTGAWKTKQAQQYPPKMCRCVASLFQNFEAQCRASNFEKRLV